MIYFSLKLQCIKSSAGYCIVNVRQVKRLSTVTLVFSLFLNGLASLRYGSAAELLLQYLTIYQSRTYPYASQVSHRLAVKHRTPCGYPPHSLFRNCPLSSLFSTKRWTSSTYRPGPGIPETAPSSQASSAFSPRPSMNRRRS